MQLNSYPGVATTSFFFFLSSFFYPLSFYCLFSLLPPFASRDFCENVFLVLGVNKVHCWKPYVKITNLGGGKSIFCAKERDVSLLFVRSTAAILTNNTQALLHV